MTFPEGSASWHPALRSEIQTGHEYQRIEPLGAAAAETQQESGDLVDSILTRDSDELEPTVANSGSSSSSGLLDGAPEMAAGSPPDLGTSQGHPETLYESPLTAMQEKPIGPPAVLHDLNQEQEQDSGTERNVSAPVSLQSTVESLQEPQAQLQREEDKPIVLLQEAHLAHARPEQIEPDTPDRTSMSGLENIKTSDIALYEFQGQSNEIEAARQEDPTVTLLTDSESGPLQNERITFDTPTQSDDGPVSPEDPDPIAVDPASSDLTPAAVTESGLAVPGPDGEETGWGSAEGDPLFDDLLQPAGSMNVAAAEEHTASESDLQSRSVSVPNPDAGASDIDDMWAAAFDDDELLDGPAANTIDPSGFFDEDDAGFLDDASASTQQPPIPKATDQSSTFGITSLHEPVSMSSRYQPGNILQPANDPRPASTPSSFLPTSLSPFTDAIRDPNAPRRPQLPPKPSSSFADRSKSGYASPYDLPTDIVAPRKRAPAPFTPVPTASIAPVPPPRSSSVPGPATPSGSTPIVPQLASSALSKPPSSNADFFADLPMTSKPKTRQAVTGGFYQPQQQAVGPPQLQRASTQPMAVPSAGAIDPDLAGLQKPQRLPLYTSPSTSNVPPAAQLHSTVSSQYSPAPAAAQAQPAISRSSTASVPIVQSRYAAAPIASNVGVRGSAFVPKTSSPLAYHEDLLAQGARQAPPTSAQPEQYGAALPDRVMTPPQLLPKSMSAQSSPRQPSRYAPLGSSQPSGSLSPPKRPNSQSPLQVKRVISTNVAEHEHNPALLQQTAAPIQMSLPSRRSVSLDLNFAVPQDERSADHLERWKGHPIIHWSPNGTVLTSFPNQAPFYAVGHAIPVIKCTPGPIRIHDNKTARALDDVNATFPGPLHGRGKSKKKDVVSWLSTKIESLEKRMHDALLDPTTNGLLTRRAEEKVVLWKVCRLLIENDNVLDGKTGVDEALRRLLVPNDLDAQSPITTLANVTKQLDTTPEALQEVRKLLFSGEREKAVWLATEKHMWSHAMLIASTMGPAVWKQLAHEFVKAQVQSQDHGTRSLAALYEIFAGNWDECVDEIVPPFARAGISVINGTGSSINGANSEGLEKWRETLALILSNRSANDVQAIAALGRLLSGYGRIEAAHTCYILAKGVARHGGSDDSDAAFVLLGADEKAQSIPLGVDLDTILLTEVYEFMLTLNPTSASSSAIPYLQPYKFVHAVQLAESGLRAESQGYCDSIFAAIKSTTKASPYYHSAFTSAVEDLSRCLSQAPQTSAGLSLFSKMSSDKVSGSMWKKFNSFVAGEEDETASNASGQNEVAESGPFGKVNGNSPAISRAPSSADLYGTMSPGAYTNGIAGYTSPLSPPATTGGRASMTPPNMDRVASGRYAPQTGQGQHSARSASSSRAYEPQRSVSSYTTMTATNRAPVNQYAPPIAELRSTSYTPGPAPVQRPDAVRTTTDPHGAYTPTIASLTSPLNQVIAPFEPQRSASPYQPRSAPAQTMSKVGPTSSPYQPTETGFANGQHATPLHSSEEPLSNLSLPAYDATMSEGPQANSGGPYAHYAPQGDSGAASFDQQPVTIPEPSYEIAQGQPSTFEAPSFGYEPPTMMYASDEAEQTEVQDEVRQPLTEEPTYKSSYQPYEPSYGDDNTVDSEEPAAQPKKKSFMDLSDDEDNFPRNRPPPPQDRQSTGTDESVARARLKADADRAADEAFRKAAEADAERDQLAKEAAAKKGWFGGWFAGKNKDGTSLDEQPKAIKAKLGEDSSFYFDKDLGKWVNKKASKEDQAKTAAPTPPPPRAGPLGGPPGVSTPPIGPPGTSGPARGFPPPSTPGSGPPSRPGTAGPPGGSTPMPGPGLGSASGPPSRPGTAGAGLSNASSIDDLLGVPGAAKKGGTIKGKKRGGRYVDVMAK